MKHSLLADLLGEYIVERRRVLDITQTSLAHQLRCSAQFLGRIEKGYALMPKPALVKAISLLDLDPSRCRKIFRTAAENEVEELYKEARKAPRKKKTKR